MSDYIYLLVPSAILNVILCTFLFWPKKDGTIQIEDFPGEKKRYSLEVDLPIEDIEKKKYIRFKVNTNKPS